MTVFIVVGIVLLFVFIGIFFMVSYVQTGTLKGEEEEYSGLKAGIISLVESCIRQTAIPGISLLAVQGGVIIPEDSEKVLLTDNLLVHYGVLRGVRLFSLERMEQQLNSYFEEQVPACLDFFIFEEQGVAIEQHGEIRTKTTIGNNFVLVALELPLKVIKGTETIRIDAFSQRFSLPFGSMVEEAENIAEQHVAAGSINTAVLAASGFFVSAFPFDQATTIYSMSQRNLPEGEMPLAFMFAIRDFSVNTPPRIQYVAPLAIRQGEPLAVEFSAEDDENNRLVFSSDSSEFPVTEEGLLEVTAPFPGKYGLTITVEDEEGLKDSLELSITVLP